MEKTQYNPSENEFGLKIRARRKELHLSQQNLADLAGFDQQEISRYERGAVHIPSVHNLVRLALALNVSTDWLLGLSEKKERE